MIVEETKGVTDPPDKTEDEHGDTTAEEHVKCEKCSVHEKEYFVGGSAVGAKCMVKKTVNKSQPRRHPRVPNLHGGLE